MSQIQKEDIKIAGKIVGTAYSNLDGNLNPDCWLVQLDGINACKNCQSSMTDECGGGFTLLSKLDDKFNCLSSFTKFVLSEIYEKNPGTQFLDIFEEVKKLSAEKKIHIAVDQVNSLKKSYLNFLNPVKTEFEKIFGSNDFEYDSLFVKELDNSIWHLKEITGIDSYAGCLDNMEEEDIAFSITDIFIDVDDIIEYAEISKNCCFVESFKDLPEQIDEKWIEENKNTSLFRDLLTAIVSYGACRASCDFYRIKESEIEVMEKEVNEKHGLNLEY